MFEQARRSKITLWVDENSKSLVPSLKALGFKVLVVPQGAKDEEIFSMLENDAFITKNTKDFKIAAIVHDFDLISIESIKFIDPDESSKNQTSNKIAKAVRESRFYSARGNFLLTVFDDGSWNLARLV